MCLSVFVYVRILSVIKCNMLFIRKPARTSFTELVFTPSLPPPTTPYLLPGEGRGAKAELCPAGDDGWSGPGAEPRVCGVQDLLCVPTAGRGRPAEGVSPLFLQVKLRGGG